MIWTDRVISKENAEHYVWGGVNDGWRLVQTSELSIIHECMPPGASEVRHYHRTAQQYFFILSGKANMDIDGRVETLAKHQGIEIAPGIPHLIRNDFEHDVEFLVISQPPTRNDRVVIDD
jgi:mannose-6-phosphate isomerase-like protein (cupin superfamily)